MLRQPYGKDDAIMNEVMWRNVLISSLWQSIILALAIFKGPGWLTEDYWSKCKPFKPGSNNTKCSKWNPFFIESLYISNKTNALWKSRNLTQADFNPVLLNK
jgi:hypothetical protein